MMLVKDLEFGYSSSNPILQSIAFKAHAGECLAILGNNGAGKSTLLKCINRILSPQKGAVYVGHEDILKMPLNQVAQNIAFVAQGTQNSRLTVYDMVMLGRKPYIKWGVRQEDEAVVANVLQKMGMEDMAVRYVDELSGGEQQKVMLARALAQQPRILLLDEPTSNLDLRNQYEVLELVTQISREHHIAVILVIHDLNLALRYCDKFLLLKDNQIYDYGGAEIITAESIREVYQIPVNIHTIDGAKVVIPQI
ncbi:MAG: ABC transporter ATP-binding protein [Oscillospiraceae bacterium]